MLLSSEPHVHYERNALLEVICQIRFPTILKINSEPPAAFQDQIRRDFPKYAARQEHPAPVVTGAGTGNPVLQPQETIINHNFISADGRWKINLTKDFFSLSTMGYRSWDEFARKFDLPFAKFIQLYQPADFERIGLRYMNAISREELGEEDAKWSDWIEPHFLGLFNAEELDSDAARKAVMDVELLLPGNIFLKVHAGPGTVRRQGGQEEKRARFILDNDLSVAGNLSASQVAQNLELLHENAWRVFRGAITQELHEVLRPE